MNLASTLMEEEIKKHLTKHQIPSVMKAKFAEGNERIDWSIPVTSPFMFACLTLGFDTP